MQKAHGTRSQPVRKEDSPAVFGPFLSQALAKALCEHRHVSSAEQSYLGASVVSMLEVN